MQLNMLHRMTSQFFADLPTAAVPGQPQFWLRCPTALGTVWLRFASRAQLKNQVIDAFTIGVGGMPALGFNVDRKTAATRHEAFEARLRDGYCGLLFLGYPFEIVSQDGKDFVGGRPPVHVRHFPTPSQRDEFGFDASISWKLKQPQKQRQHQLRRLIARRDAIVCGGGEMMAAFGSALLASSPRDALCDIAERLAGPLAALPHAMVLSACSAAALQLLIQSFGANPCAKFISDAWQFIALRKKVTGGEELNAEELVAQARLLDRWDADKMLAFQNNSDAGGKTRAAACARMRQERVETGRMHGVPDVEPDPRSCSVCKAQLPYSSTVWAKDEFFQKADGKGTCTPCRKKEKAQKKKKKKE